MELIDRYVYAVIKNLPEKQREDIEKELRTHIDDMIEQYEDSESYEDNVKKVLMQLGDPKKLAENYRGSKRYLIGPQYIDIYFLVLKICLGAVMGGISIAIIVGSIFSDQKDLLDITLNYISAIFSGLLQAFAWTTIAFAITEQVNANRLKSDAEDGLKKEDWSLSELPKIPEKKAIISPAEAIVSIVFTTIFMIILLYAPKLFAVYISSADGVTVIPLFNLDILKGLRFVFVTIFILSILKEVLKLLSRRWTLKLSLSFAILTLISTVMMLFVFTNPSVWNPDFSKDVMMKMNLGFDFVNIWSGLKSVFIAVIILTGVIDISKALYKGVKYNA